MTYRYICYSIQKQIKQTFDDADITIPQIVYWVNIIAKRLKYERIKKSKSDAYLTYFPDVLVLTHTQTGRKYTLLPAPIVDLDNDIGIDTVCYTASDSNLCGCEDPLQNPFNRTTTRQVVTLYGNPYRKPSPSNPYFYRNRINIDGELKEAIVYAGIECVNVDKVDMYIYSTESSDTVCDLDTEVDINPEQEKILYFEVLNLARFGFMIQSDKKNDGSDTSNQGSKPVGVAPIQQDSDTPQQAQQ